MTSDKLLVAAHRFGDKIAKQALWNDGSCTWIVAVLDRANVRARRVSEQTSDGSLYGGTAGIALFLAELAGRTGDHRLWPTVHGALEHAISACGQLPISSFGFHNGRIGVAFVLARVAQLTGRADYFDDALRILSPMRGEESRDEGLDIVAGAAGAIPALIALLQMIDFPDGREMIEALGQHLLRRSNRSLRGWSWPSNLVEVANLTGLAHGAAGFAHALLELFAFSGDGRYLHAARQAFAYERSLFDRSEGNWLDCRCGELQEILQSPKDVEALRIRVRNGGPGPSYEPHFMTAWCHGASGIALTRLRAFQILGDPQSREEAILAVEKTAKEVVSPPLNYSLCHGHFGNCETLLLASSVLNRPDLLAEVQTVVDEALQRFGDGRSDWPTGAIGAHRDPSLMVGEAGMGYFLLRLSDVSTPSILLVQPSIEHAPRLDDPIVVRGVRQSQQETIADFFAHTLKILRYTTGELRPLESMFHSVTVADGCELPAAFERLERRINAERDVAKRQLLCDGFAIDKAKFEVAGVPFDKVQEMVKDLTRREAPDLDWDQRDIALGTSARVVKCNYDWHHWDADLAPPPASRITYFVVARRGDRIVTTPVGPFAGVVLESIRRPASLPMILDSVTEVMSENAIGGSEFRDRVVAQLTAALKSGLVDTQVKESVPDDLR